jgi:hypothetical protein
LFRVLAFCCIFGIVRKARQSGLHPYHVFAAFFVPVLLAWNYPPHERFSYPIFPLLLAGFTTELTHMAALARNAWKKSEAGQRVVAAVFSLILVALIAFAVRSTWRGLEHDIPAVFSQDRSLRPRMVKAYQWIAMNIPQGSAFLAYDDPSLFLHTGRYACGMHAPTRGITQEQSTLAVDYFSSMPDLARSNGYDYIFLTGSDFLQDIGRLDRIKARQAIDRDERTVTLYHDGNVSVRRVLR